MYRIYKVRICAPIDYAAEELKKYLRMMMPEAGDVTIEYKPDATEGFRLGLMQDFGLDVSDVDNVELDDILYADTDENGGIIAGDNPRSVLLSVYEYLRRNGCRWLFPGVDGEFIPMQDIIPVKFRHVPSCRFRGQCNEGAEFQSNMLEAIEFTPKVGLNIFMQEFYIPSGYYQRYYDHPNNPARPAESVTDATVLQWKRQCECEIAKRGLQYHDMGHGWSTEPFGIDPNRQDWNPETCAAVPPEKLKYLAMKNGERKIYANHPFYTNFCMGNGEYRKMVVDSVLKYARKHQNVDYLHIWLGDSTNAFCECELCRDTSATDWYVTLLNEIDEAMIEEGLDMRLVFCLYKDTLWAPIKAKLKNPKRYSAMLGAVTRNYLETTSPLSPEFKLMPYVLNKITLPQSLTETFEYLKEWKKAADVDAFAYEYHFWYHQFNDLGGTQIARLINNDVKAYLENNVQGIIEDGSQRSYFPTGLAFYTYARSMFDTSLSYDQIEEEYFSCAFGEDWRAFRDYLDSLGHAFGVKYMERKGTAYPEVSALFDPEHAKSIAKAYDIIKEGEELIKSHYNSEFRIRTVSVRILEKHAKYARLLADALIKKAEGHDDEADALFAVVKEEMGKEELSIERWYDHSLAMTSLNMIFSVRTKVTEEVTDFWRA